MNQNLTEVIFLLDRSGSMSTLTKDTIGGFNSFVADQKTQEGETKLTTILFDDQYEILHNGVNVKDIKDMTTKEYSARGYTALLDAIGKTINTVGDRLANTPEEDRPSKVMFIITTDGEENSSKEFTQPQIKEMIQTQTNEYNWTFLFLGANIDAVSTANDFGLSRGCASNYSASSVGTQSIYTSLSKTIRDYKDKGVVCADWASKIK